MQMIQLIVIIAVVSIANVYAATGSTVLGQGQSLIITIKK
jgi:hypothetical protein